MAERKWQKFVSLGMLLAVAGCQRGCLASWLSGRGVGDDASARNRALLGSIDCPDALVKCVGGVAEISVGGVVSTECVSSPEKPHACDCPFAPVATCSHGCVIEDVVVLAKRSDASRVCAPAPSEIFSRPSSSSSRAFCEDEAARFRCEQSTVFACAASGAEAISSCFQGCFADGEELSDDDIDIHIATSLLCRARRDIELGGG